MVMVHIITVIDGMVERVQTLHGNDLRYTSRVEGAFLDEVERRITNFHDFTVDDIEAICDNGYVELGDGDGSVQLHWSEESC